MEESLKIGYHRTQMIEMAPCFLFDHNAVKLKVNSHKALVNTQNHGD